MNRVCLNIENLTMKYEDKLIQENLTFPIYEGDIFVVMGGSGCGKSTLLRHLVGLKKPSSGKVFIYNESLWDLDEDKRQDILREFGVSFQSGALWTSMTLKENVSLSLEEYTNYSKNEISEIAKQKLSLVGLSGFEGYYPFEISGGMKKRAGIARAMALDPKVLFLDEPSAGLDPISSKNLDDLIIKLNKEEGVTVVIITHELDSIFRIGTNSVFLDAETKTMQGYGSPKELLKNGCEKVRRFLQRGEL
ncbi:MAG: ATP-binding cassette domain-containing protein [Bdellovibrionota bacterium]|nr:ATP-binding cassette domain-containing protein [Bdellovibrionota bacterium]